MPELLKALIVILLLASTVFAFAKPTCSALIGIQTFNRWRVIWFALTLAAFLAHSFWLYALIAILILSIAARHEHNKVALFFLALFLVPPVTIEIPWFGLINNLFAIDNIGLLCLVILLPAYLKLHIRGDITPFGRLTADKLLAAYILLVVFLHFRDSSTTAVLRQAFVMFIGIFLPYFVISRSLKTVKDFRRVLAAFTLPIMVLAAIGIFETAKNWLLYRSMINALGLHWDFSNYLSRGGMLRAQGTAGQPIAYGLLMVAGMGMMLYLKNHIPVKRAGAGMALLAGGLAASLSRGPWVAAALMIIVFIATGPNALHRLMKFSFAALIVFAALAILPGGQSVIDLLPWIGSVEKGGIEYRSRVFDASLVTIQRNPFFGDVYFTQYPEMQDLIQGEGLIDIVNVYLLIALKYGLITLAFLAGFFALIVARVFQRMRQFPDDHEAKLLGRALLASMIGIMAAISTVSDITFIPIVYLSFAALGIAYSRINDEQAHRYP
jgi:O-antigen ligase